eukprot:gene15289-2521_t
MARFHPWGTLVAFRGASPVAYRPASRHAVCVWRCGVVLRQSGCDPVRRGADVSSGCDPGRGGEVRRCDLGDQRPPPPPEDGNGRYWPKGSQQINRDTR